MTHIYTQPCTPRPRPKSKLNRHHRPFLFLLPVNRTIQLPHEAIYQINTQRAPLAHLIVGRQANTVVLNFKKVTFSFAGKLNNDLTLTTVREGIFKNGYPNMLSRLTTSVLRPRLRGISCLPMPTKFPPIWSTIAMLTT